VLFDSCMQFRMSKTEVENYFRDQPVPGVREEYSVGRQRITYVRAGEKTKPLVVFVHGSPGSLSAFIHFLKDSVLLQHVQELTIDRPGFGDANFGKAEPSLKRQAEVLMPAIRKEANGQPVILVGHSLGGPVIARMAMDYPDEIDGLVFVAASNNPDLEPDERWFRGPLHSPVLRWMVPRSFRASNDEILNLQDQLDDMLPLWKSLRMPACVIQGANDKLVHPANASFTKKQMTNARVNVMVHKDMNHFIPWTHPATIRQAVLDLLPEASAYRHARSQERNEQP
jgi:pimeloyl-ACP methyl ester carboxylesterase